MTRTPTPFRRAFVAVPALTLVAALTLAGCGSSDDEAESTPEPTVEQTVGTEPEATTPAPEETDEAEAPASGDALQDYVELELAQLEELGDTLGDVYSDISIEPAPPSGIVYSYTYSEQLDPAVAEESLAGIGETLEEMLDTAVFPMMIQSGVEEPVSATYTYLNADGSELWSETFTSE